MPIRPYLNGQRFGPETTRVLGVALELVCIALHTGDCDDYLKQAIADKIIALAKAGERNPDILCERALGKSAGHEVGRSGDWAAFFGEARGVPTGGRAYA